MVRPDWLGRCLILIFVCAGHLPAYADNSLQRTIHQVLKHVNLQRSIIGNEPLTLNARLTEAAQKHAADMAERDYFKHRSPGGLGLKDRIASSGYSWSVIAENLAAGYASPETTVNSWMKSSSHRVAILNRQFKETGIGYAKPEKDAEKSRYSHYWVIIFGAQPK